MGGRRGVWILGAAMLALAVPAVAEACPVCFGQAEGPAAEALNRGVLVMLGVVGAVQFGFVALFVGIWRRGKRLAQQREGFTVINGGNR